MENYTERNVHWKDSIIPFALVLGFLILTVIVPVMRTSNGQPTYAGDVSYDTLLFQTGNMSFPASVYSLYARIPENIQLGLNALLVAFSMLIFVVFLKQYRPARHVRWFILALLGLSPVMLSSGSQLSPAALLLFLSVLTLFVGERKPALLFIPSLLLLFTSPISWMFVTGIQSVLGVRTRVWKISTIAGLLLLVFMRITGLAIGIPRLIPLGFVADLGHATGQSIFLLILSILGIFIAWQSLPRRIQLAFVVFIVAIFFSSEVLLLSTFVTATLGGLGLNILLRRRWGFVILRDASILLVACGLLFSCLAYVSEGSKGLPSQHMAGALSTVKAFPAGVIITPFEFSSFSSYESGKSDFFYASGGSETSKSAIYSALLNSTKYNEAAETLAKTGAKYNYIVLTSEDLAKERSGLAFLVENSERFISVARYSDVEVWLHIRP
ncbi:MAG: hypothetical protein ABIA93_02070 [Candidatus Woesearchaeota archaeon]